MKTVLLLFGGESTEHDVSVVSAGNVVQAIDRRLYTLTLGYIDKEGAWWQVDQVSEMLPEGAHQLLPILGKGSFAVEGTDSIITPDVILPILHGHNGEDGSVQALGQLLHIPVVGCDMTASAIGMDKFITKQVALANNIRVVPFLVHYVTDALPVYEDVATKLSPTVFVKPGNAGSSVGVSKVTNQAELETALAEAHHYADLVLIEKALDVRELEVAVIGNYPHIEASAVSEVKPDREFYNYESKYDESSASQVIIPAELSDEVTNELRQLAVRIFHLIGGSGMARVDFFIDTHAQEIYLNELNTIPGFTNISVYPKAWEHAGIHYPELIDRLIALALE